MFQLLVELQRITVSHAHPVINLSEKSDKQQTYFDFGEHLRIPNPISL